MLIRQSKPEIFVAWFNELERGALTPLHKMSEASPKPYGLVQALIQMVQDKLGRYI
jgi:hypothetical protein